MNKRVLSSIRNLAFAAICASICAAMLAGSATASDSDRFGPQKKIRIKAGKSPFGLILFNRDRQATYAFDLEKSGRSRCYDECADAWPPVLTRGRPTAAGKTKQSLLGVTKRRGGARQVTYDGRSLYYYAHEGPGQVFCNDVFEFGGNWLVPHPSGRIG